MKQIDAETRSVLERSVIEGQVLKLPGQLPRDEYARVDKVLKGLGGKWDRKAGGHTFPFDPSDLLVKAVDEGAYTDRKQELQFFETPEDLAVRMCVLAGVRAGCEMLEPEAGHGRIALVATQLGARVTMVEIDEHNAAVLLRDERLREAKFVMGDFIEWAYEHAGRLKFKAVVMNPPFSNSQDIAHVLAAWKLVEKGGTLVAVMAEGTFFRQDAKANGFREWMKLVGATSERLPVDTFKTSGTQVATRIVMAIK